MTKKALRLTQDVSELIVTVGNQTKIFDINLVKYHMSISYTRKVGTVATEEDIKIKKEAAQNAYLRKIIQSKTPA